MRYLLDTNAISHAVDQPRGSAAMKIREVWPSASVITSIIVASELRYGYTRISSRRLKEAYELFFENVAIESWEAPFDRVYADVRSTMEKKGRVMGAMDMLIAAHALATDATVITDDQSFAHVPGLKVENWLRESPAA